MYNVIQVGANCDNFNNLSDFNRLSEQNYELENNKLNKNLKKNSHGIDMENLQSWDNKQSIIF